MRSNPIICGRHLTAKPFELPTASRLEADAIPSWEPRLPEPLNPTPQQQSEILMQALPHMLRYDDAIVVVKYGGHAMGDEDKARDFAKDMVLLEQSGINPVVVHGGGPQIGAMLKKLGIKSQFSGGLRVTDKPTMEIVEMVLAGSINKQIVGSINAEGGRAVGLCGKDGNMVTARKVHRPHGRRRRRRRSRLCRRAGQGGCDRARARFSAAS